MKMSKGGLKNKKLTIIAILRISKINKNISRILDFAKLPSVSRIVIIDDLFQMQ